MKGAVNLAKPLNRCYKFRTMYLDSDERLENSLEGDPNARWEWEVYRKLKLQDPRLTPHRKVSTEMESG